MKPLSFWDEVCAEWDAGLINYLEVHRLALWHFKNRNLRYEVLETIECIERYGA